MSSWLKAMNPSTPITTEAEAERAAKASAISIMIGVVVGLASLAWTFANPSSVHDAVAAASNGDPAAMASSDMALQVGLWMGGGLVLLQIIFGAIQWRRPNQFIAILFMVLIAFGLVSSLAAPLMAASMPNVPATPMWQIVLSVVVMIVQMVLHVTGLKGIKALDRIQMEQAR
ncbi:hypothetical protein ACETK8_15990 [Brevundimonas staleyi]|uniref:Uncharacterized protein n=1 Tax=Brevundimonas staleyi TaxID=74326 RepID=A0ABW0FTU1_9CAUL